MYRTIQVRRVLVFFNDTATTEIYTLSLHDALPISPGGAVPGGHRVDLPQVLRRVSRAPAGGRGAGRAPPRPARARGGHADRRGQRTGPARGQRPRAHVTADRCAHTRRGRSTPNSSGPGSAEIGRASCRGRGE